MRTNIYKFDVQRAYMLQLEIAKHAMLRDDFKHIQIVAGVDLSYSRGEEEGLAVVVTLNYPSLNPLEVRVAYGRVPIPYIPGLLAFREAPLAYTAYLRLAKKPDLLVIDGHGLAHPRKAGIATHIGVALDKPSIGVAKKKLVGEECQMGAYRALCLQKEYVAIIIQHRGRKLYVSPGHRVSLKTAYALIKSMLRPKASLPLPTYIADRLSKAAKRIEPCRHRDVKACEEQLLEKAYLLRKHV